MITEDRIKMFWKNVDIKSPDECWNWKRSTTRDGYGKVKINGKVISSHRAAYLIAYWKITDKMCVIHSCDNKLCCNPAHLSEGTHSDNMQDMIKKGRQGKVTRYKTKLCMEKAREIRRLWESGETVHALSRMFGVCCLSIRQIVKGMYWKDTHENA